MFCRKIDKKIDVATHDEREDNVGEVVGNQISEGLVSHCDNCHFYLECDSKVLAGKQRDLAFIIIESQWLLI